MLPCRLKCANRRPPRARDQLLSPLRRPVVAVVVTITTLAFEAGPRLVS